MLNAMVIAALFVAIVGFPMIDKRFASPEDLDISPGPNAARWKQLPIRWNNHVRYSGLLVMWLGLCSYLVKARRAPEMDGTVFLIVAGIGVLVLSWGLLWRRFVTVSDNVAT